MSGMFVVTILLGSLFVCISSGLSLLRFATHRAPPPLPPATLIHAGPVETAVAHTARASRLLLESWRPLVIIGGVALMAAPFVVIWQLVSMLMSFDPLLP